MIPNSSLLVQLVHRTIPLLVREIINCQSLATHIRRVYYSTQTEEIIQRA